MIISKYQFTNILGCAYIVIAILAQSASLILGKYAGLSGIGLEKYLNIYYVASLGALGIQAIFWQQALKSTPLSVAYPMLSLVFVIIPFASYVFFNESISLFHILGTIFILLGTFIINVGGDDNG